MAEETLSGELMPSLSSFKGRLDIHNFRFEGREQPDVQQKPRCSERLSSRVDKSFKPTKPVGHSKTSTPGQKKRTAVDLPDSSITRLERTATVPALCEQADAALSSRKKSKLEQADIDSHMPLSDGSMYMTNGLRGTYHATDASQGTLKVISNGKSKSVTMDTVQKKKRARPKAGYAPPSTFAHLPPLRDAMAPNLFVLFCGLNPGIQTAISGHAYSNPTNRFWKLMYSSGVLPVPCTPEEDRTLPMRFRLGLTNIVERPSRNGAQLSKAEMDAGVPVLEEKVRRWRPEVICLVGKSIWESVWRVHHDGKAVNKAFHKAFKYGWQDESENMGIGNVNEREDGVTYVDDWKGARVFVASSTSGLAATLSPAEKERIWRELGIWVEKRRAQAEIPDEEFLDKVVEEKVLDKVGSVVS